ncbi:hypothetical protein ELI13_23185 [Rhizobium ruizarguesonis]|uniref:hypothetical protein n=1 Tax=Rhizobium TaxID=379 RepID=UPI00103031FD|nr:MULTISPECIES: hypothetical protein [Rhizobium]MBY2907113.1 hypothetical protein [Rhizobium leguminosarum]TAV35309.1 hypothetical protein ELI36_24205 [Rhizobium ruizarguesonis]TAW67265.1 hypothetical protein ELI15_24230 [Rhizobium ruizarguesonis]TAW91408.1 hypothetical protein ELI13_23185 [Rhizobium ruizarguesonis]TAZ59299.1 hypothetical protein ELH71_24345 [Rhizobium ruizarguesonis]
MGVVVRNLYNVNGRWKYRKVIPVTLRPHVPGNLTEFVRWLGSGSQNSAEVTARYSAAAKECESLLEVAKKRSLGSYDELSAEMIAHIIGTERSNLLWEDDEDRFDQEADILFEHVRQQLAASGAGAIVNDDPDRRWNNRQETLEAYLANLRHDYARGTVDAFHIGELTDLCASHGLLVDPQSLSFRRLAKAYLGMQIEVSEARLQRQSGVIVPTPEPPKTTTVQQVISGGLTLRELAEKKLTMKNKSEATAQATETALRLFESIYGTRAMETITRREVADWIFLLQKKPATPDKEHRALGLREMVAAYETRKDVPRLTGKSVNGHVSHLNSIWAWARQRGFVDRSLDNPFGEQRVDERPPEANEGFTPTQLQALFNLPVFTKGERPKGGRGEAAFWLPLLLLTYGTRPEEMCQLLVSDITYDDEEALWCLRITDEGLHPVKGLRHIKADGNALVRRSLPITQKLIELGFIDYVERLRQTGELAVFPLLTTKGKLGYLHSSFATWWGKYAREHKAIPESGNKPLRGFRDTWTTAAARSGVTEEEREWIQGHYVGKGKTANRNYGTRDFGKKIEQINFRGLDLSKLLPPKLLREHGD